MCQTAPEGEAGRAAWAGAAGMGSRRPTQARLAPAVVYKLCVGCWWAVWYRLPPAGHAGTEQEGGREIHGVKKKLFTKGFAASVQEVGQAEFGQARPRGDLGCVAK